MRLMAGSLVALALALGACSDPEPAALPPPPLVKKLTADEAGDAAVATGKLVLRNDCLVLEDANRVQTLLLWPAEAQIMRTPEGVVRVSGAAAKGQRTVQVGERITVSGGELGTGADTALVGPGRSIEASAAFPARCTGGVWNVYGFKPAGELGAAELEGRWVVAKLNGAGYGPGDHVVHVTVKDGHFRAQSQCASYGWTVSASAGAFHAAQETPSGPGCQRARTMYERAFEEAINRATSLEQRDGALLIRGAGGQVLLKKE